MLSVILILCLFSTFLPTPAQDDFCAIKDQTGECSGSEESREESPLNLRYIFYDVNPPEGFNLRRDVYMRMAIFARKLNRHLNCYMVLPPWSNLYHWQSDDITEQTRLPWSLFFDLKSLQSFAPVIEMTDFFETGLKVLDQVYILQHFEDMFTSGNFKDRLELGPCAENMHYKRSNKGYIGYFWDYRNITAKDVQCLSFHGPTSQLVDFVKKDKARTIMFDHAEVALHDRFGDKTYWNARKSLKFAQHLIDEAERYQTKHLNWTKERDGNPWPNSKRNAVGGNYLSVHLRRRDFLRGHSKNVPSIEGAAKQIEAVMNKLGLENVFVATDATNKEKRELKSKLLGKQVLMYNPSAEVKSKWKDGGVAIIEQIICSNARHFIGTHESTFSFTIREEREIMGFPPEATFQRLCGDNEPKCRPPTQWLIVH